MVEVCHEFSVSAKTIIRVFKKYGIRGEDPVYKREQILRGEESKGGKLTIRQGLSHRARLVSVQRKTEKSHTVLLDDMPSMSY